MSVVEWLSLFVWEPGECFKCEDADVPVTHFGVLEGERGTVELFTCKGCCFRLSSRYTAELAGTHLPARAPLRALPQSV